jgi:uncharacterized protein with von Willebrand factor type A (vWA) domain
LKRAELPAPPAESACWIETDRYDRRVFGELRAAVAGLDEFLEKGRRFLPHFEALLQDLFAALFKNNVVWLSGGSVRPAAVLNRALLGHLIQVGGVALLREQCVLEEGRAFVAALALGEEIVASVERRELLNLAEMRDLWELAHAEQELESRFEQSRALDQTAAERPGPDESRQTLASRLQRHRDEASHALRVARGRVRQKQERLEDYFRRRGGQAPARLGQKSLELAAKLERVAQDERDFGLEFGGGARSSAAERIELSRFLLKSPRIGNLARLVGRLRSQARALRRERFASGASEFYELERGAELGRLIPGEFLALRNDLLARDFKRRLLEATLMQYRLRADPKGKGPMVVCVDVSSSMQGDKELWAKALALALLDIARRERRRSVALLFAAPESEPRVFELNHRRRYQVELATICELAEYFPGGGTDFMRPLDTAAALLEEGSLKHGDIVIITDGQAQVDSRWLQGFSRRKQLMAFRVFAVMVDVGSTDLATVASFSDHVTAVRRLGPEATGDLFLKIQE